MHTTSIEMTPLPSTNIKQPQNKPVKNMPKSCAMFGKICCDYILSI